MRDAFINGIIYAGMSAMFLLPLILMAFSHASWWQIGASAFGGGIMAAVADYFR